jgi:hypothetical protein
MERGGPSRAPPAGDAQGPLLVAVRARAMQQLDLPAELLMAVAAQLAEDDDLAFALACHRLRQSVAGTERRGQRAAFDKDWLGVLLGGQAGVGRGVVRAALQRQAA